MSETTINRQITLGYDAEGKRIRKWVHAKTEAEFRKLRDTAIKEYATSGITKECTFKKYADHWFETYKSKKSVRTQEHYEYAIGKLEELNSRKLSDIRKSEVQKIIMDNYEHARTCAIISQVAKAIFDAAIQDDLLRKNPAEGLDLPKYVPAENRKLTDEELEAIKKANLPKDERMFVDIMLQFGLRPEEARALNKSSFDFKRQEIRITSAVTFDDNNPVLKDTKTHRNRTLPIPSSLLPRIIAYSQKLRTFYFFTMKNGEIMTKSSYRRFCERVFGEINRKLGGNETIDMLNGMTFYTFRHNKATQLYYLEGISTKKKAAYMGHSELMFLKIYSHLDGEKEAEDILKKAVI